MDGFAALADPRRRQIVDLLMDREQASGEIASHFDVSAAAISQHLKVLREAKLVRVRGQGQRRIYAIDPGGFAELEAWVARARRFWKSRLDTLEEVLRADEEGAGGKSPKPKKGT